MPDTWPYDSVRDPGKSETGEIGERERQDNRGWWGGRETGCNTRVKGDQPIVRTASRIERRRDRLYAPFHLPGPVFVQVP